MKLLPACLWVLALALGFGAAYGFAKEPEPNAAAVQKEQDVIKKAYADDFKKLPTSAKILVEKLVEAAKGEKDSARKYALLLEAASVAADGGEYGLAMTLIDDRARAFEFDGLKARGDLLESLRKRMRDLSKDTDRLRDLYVHAIDTATRALKADSLDVAEAAAKMAQLFATSISGAGTTQKSPGLKEEGGAKKTAAIAILDAVKKRTEQQSLYKKGQQTLKERPDDPSANLGVGCYLTFVLGKRDGLPHLAKSDQQEIADLAKEELAIREGDKPDLQRLCDMADKWWRLAESKKLAGVKPWDLKKHAVDLYESVPPDVMPPVTRQLAKQRADEMRKENPFEKLRIGCYKTFRLVARKSNGNGWQAFYREIEFIDADTGRKLQGGQALASHPKGDPERAAASAAAAFDGDIETKHETAGDPARASDWIQYTMPYQVRLGSVRILQSGDERHHIFDVELLGSNDGESWAKLKTFEGIPGSFDSGPLPKPGS